MKAAPESIATRLNRLGTTPYAATPAFRPLLVPPNFFLSFPECPFDVARTAGSIVAVPRVLVRAVVAKVLTSFGDDSERKLSLMKTSAKPGEGTGTLHVFAV